MNDDDHKLTEAELAEVIRDAVLDHSDYDGTNWRLVARDVRRAEAEAEAEEGTQP